MTTPTPLETRRFALHVTRPWYRPLHVGPLDAVEVNRLVARFDSANLDMGYGVTRKVVDFDPVTTASIRALDGLPDDPLLILKLMQPLGLPQYAVVISQPGRDPYRIGPFDLKHMADMWAHRLTWSPGRARPQGATATVHPYDPTTVYDLDPDTFRTDVLGLAERITSEPADVGGEDSWPDTWDLLGCKVNYDQALRLWRQATDLADRLDIGGAADTDTGADAPGPEQPAGVPENAVALYLTAASQHVYVIPHPMPDGTAPHFRWVCLGCGRRGHATHPATADQHTTTHAAACRRIPLPGHDAWPEGT